MPIINQRHLNKMTDNNKDEFGKFIVDLAKKIMDQLDTDATPLVNGYYPDPHTAHGLIHKTLNDMGEPSITGTMAAYMIQIIYGCHSRGQEFVDSYNNKIDKNEYEKNDRPIEKIKITEHYPTDILHKGGNWLGNVREWIQCKIPNGDEVNWGSNDLLGDLTIPTQPVSFTVRDVEEIGSVAAAAVYNEIGCGPDEVQKLRHKVKMSQNTINQAIKIMSIRSKEWTKEESDLYGELLWARARLGDTDNGV